MAVRSKSPLTLFDRFVALLSRLVGYSSLERAAAESVVWGYTKRMRIRKRKCDHLLLWLNGTDVERDCCVYVSKKKKKIWKRRNVIKRLRMSLLVMSFWCEQEMFPHSFKHERDWWTPPKYFLFPIKIGREKQQANKNDFIYMWNKCFRFTRVGNQAELWAYF